MTFSSDHAGLYPFRNLRKSRIATLLGAVLCVTSFASEVPAQTAKTEITVQSAVLILHPHGFEPAEVTVQAGLTAIYVYNRVGLPRIGPSARPGI